MQFLKKSIRITILLTAIIFFSATHVDAHSDFWRMKTFGNVKVRIRTGFYYEEINKVWIIGQLAQQLCSHMKYTDTVLLDFNHAYTDYCIPDYFLSFGDGAVIYNWGDGEKEPGVLKKDALVIKEVSRIFDAHKTLKLLDYAITHLSPIKTSQRTIVYEKNYCQWRIQTIGLSILKTIAASISSTVVDKVMTTPVFRMPDGKQDPNSLTYYYQNNYYYVTDFNGKKIGCSRPYKNIYQFISLPSNEAVIFDTDSTFYYIRTKPTVHCSGSHLIKHRHQYYQPFGYEKIDDKSIKLTFWYFGKNLAGVSPELIYKTDSDILLSPGNNSQ